jgi:hypothetical protein
MSAIVAAAASSGNGDEQGEVGKEGTPPKQQEEPVRAGDKTTTTTTTTATVTAAATITPLLPLLACLRDGACPRLHALDIDARWPATDSTSGNSSPSPLTGEPLAALAAALRQGKLRRLEVRKSTIVHSHLYTYMHTHAYSNQQSQPLNRASASRAAG